MLMVVAWLTLAASAGEATWLAEAIPVETGFDGAVTVAETVEEGAYGYATVNLPYRDVRGAKKMGQGRLVVRRTDIAHGGKIPAFCHVHYEKDVGGAKQWCEQGWAVATAHYGAPAQGGYALELATGDSYNLAKALIQWVRRLPFIDRGHLHIDGGSAGGYMALAMGAEYFPVTSITADAPVVNWAYNLNYFEKNKAISQVPGGDFKKSPVPVMAMVTMLTDWSYGVFGNDLASPTYYVVSPIAYLNRITCPTMVLASTGDMLVPLEQMTSKYVQPIDGRLFPEGYVRDFDMLAPSEATRHRFDELLAEDSYEWFVMERPEGLHEISLKNALMEEKRPGPSQSMERPWSRERQWSLVVLNEGPPLPHSDHTRYVWGTSCKEFVAAHREGVVSVALLTAPKLEHLLQRYAGKLSAVPTLADGTPCNRLNFAPQERLDVVTGLLDFADWSAEHRARLEALYAEATTKPFGEHLDLDDLRAERDRLRSEGGAP